MGFVLKSRLEKGIEGPLEKEVIYYSLFRNILEIVEY